MGGLGFQEILLIGLILLLLFGPKKLPEIGRSIGKGMNEFKKASNDFRQTVMSEIEIENRRDQRQKAAEKIGEITGTTPGTSPPAGTSAQSSAAADASQGGPASTTAEKEAAESPDERS